MKARVIPKKWPIYRNNKSSAVNTAIYLRSKIKLVNFISGRKAFPCRRPNRFALPTVYYIILVSIPFIHNRDIGVCGNEHNCWAVGAIGCFKRRILYLTLVLAKAIEIDTATEQIYFGKNQSKITLLVTFSPVNTC